MSISQNMRFHVLERDGFTCLYCGRKAPQVTLEVDHIVPTSLGGSDSMDNLRAACEDCNAGKSGHAISPPEGNAEIDCRAAHLTERLEKLRNVYELFMLCEAEKDRVFWELVKKWQEYRGEWNKKKPEASWQLAAWLRGALTRNCPEEISEAIDITMQRWQDGDEVNAIKYFCAVLRNRKAMQEDGVTNE